MEWIVKESYEVARTYICVSAARVGKDILLCLEGGSEPHIGCIVEAIPRLSLKKNGQMSVTSSVLNLSGHKDEILCRKLAEKVCSQLGVTVVCTGGVHIDEINENQIEELKFACDNLAEIVLQKLYLIS